MSDLKIDRRSVISAAIFNSFLSIMDFLFPQHNKYTQKSNKIDKLIIRLSSFLTLNLKMSFFF